jgi:hypothetical protein
VRKKRKSEYYAALAEAALAREAHVEPDERFWAAYYPRLRARMSEKHAAPRMFAARFAAGFATAALALLFSFGVSRDGRTAIETTVEVDSEATLDIPFPQMGAFDDAYAEVATGTHDVALPSPSGDSDAMSDAYDVFVSPLPGGDPLSEAYTLSDEEFIALASAMLTKRDPV